MEGKRKQVWHMPRLWYGIFTAFISAQPYVVQAQETTNLFTHKDWFVRHEYYPSTDSQACAARTPSRQGHVLDITIWGNGSHTVYIFMSTTPWSGNFEDNLKLHVDYDRWTLHDANFKSNGVVSFEFSNLDKLFEFLDDLMDGRALALKTPDERRDLAVWSLSGSYASVLKLFECYERISTDVNGSTYGASSQYGSSSTYGNAN